MHTLVKVRSATDWADSFAQEHKETRPGFESGVLDPDPKKANH